MFIKINAHRNVDAPEGGGAAASSVADQVAAQILANQGAAPAPANTPPANAAPAGDPNQPPAGSAGPDGKGTPPAAPDFNALIAEKTGGKVKSAEELTKLLENSAVEEPVAVKALREAIQKGVDPKDYYKIAMTDFEAMTDKEKWIFTKTQSDKALTPAVAEALFNEEFPDPESLTDEQKAVREYKLKKAIEGSVAEYGQIKESLLSNPGFMSAEALKAELNSKETQVSAAFDSQLPKLETITITIDTDADGKPLPADQVKSFSFKPTAQDLADAKADAMNPFRGLVEGKTPEDLAKGQLEKALYNRILPQMLKEIASAEHKRGYAEAIARMNNMQFLSQEQKQAIGITTGGSPAEQVAAQMLQRQS